MRAAWLLVGLAWGACAGAETLYRLPWADGLTFMFTQAPGGRITTHFTKARQHAVDIAMPVGMPVVAAREGIVAAAAAHHDPNAEEGPLTYEGNFVRVRHADGTAALYAHLQQGSVVVAVGDAVRAGQRLGLSGASGDVDAPHLHFAVLRTEKNSAGFEEEISVPIRFHVGAPPVAFAPRAALRVRAQYSGPAAVPRAPSETPLYPSQRPAPEAGEAPRAWGLLAAWLALGVAGLAWFWKFAKA